MKNFLYSIFYAYEALIQASSFYRKYDTLFSVLDLSFFPVQMKAVHNIDATHDARKRLPRNTTLYKHIYKKRIVVEQYFARLGQREAEQTTHYKLRSVKNRMTVAHLGHSLVSLAAAHLQLPGKIRYYRSFAHVS